jgi:MFS family permease
MGEGLWAYLRPLYITQLGADSAGVGLILAIYGLAPMLVMLPAGRLSDVFGPRRLMIGAWWLGTLGQVCLVFAPDWYWLAPGVFLLAASAAGMPAMNAYVALDASHRLGVVEAGRRMQTLLSRVIAIYVAGTIVSPLVGGWLAGQLGLRVVLLISAGWFLMSTLLVHTLPPVRLLSAKPDAGRAMAARFPAAPRPAAWWRMSADQIRVFGVLLLVYLCFSLGYSLVPSYLEDVRQLPVATIGGLGSATALGRHDLVAGAGPALVPPGARDRIGDARHRLDGAAAGSGRGGGDARPGRGVLPAGGVFRGALAVADRGRRTHASRTARHELWADRDDVRRWDVRRPVAGRAVVWIGPAPALWRGDCRRSRADAGHLAGAYIAARGENTNGAGDGCPPSKSLTDRA